MKIDEGCINHNAVRIIEELTDSIYCSDTDEKWAWMTLANIRGVIDLTKVLKEVLKE